MTAHPAHLHSHSRNLLPSPSWGTEDNDNPKAQGQGYTLLRGSLTRATRRLGGCFYSPACHPEQTGDGSKTPTSPFTNSVELVFQTCAGHDGSRWPLVATEHLRYGW